MDVIQETINKSTCILLPSGRDYEHCADVLKDVFAITVPEFLDRALVAHATGRVFIKVKSRDVPMLIQNGYGDIGLAYTDVCQEKIIDTSPIAYETIGNSQLAFSLLFPKEKEEQLKQRMHNEGLPPLIVATAYPTVFENHMKRMVNEGKVFNIKLSPTVPSGSVEAMVALGVADIVADVVNTGVTADANNLAPVRLMDISPALVYRK